MYVLKDSDQVRVVFGSPATGIAHVVRVTAIGTVTQVLKQIFYCTGGGGGELFSSNVYVLPFQIEAINRKSFPVTASICSHAQYSLLKI